MTIRQAAGLEPMQPAISLSESDQNQKPARMPRLEGLTRRYGRFCIQLNTIEHHPQFAVDKILAGVLVVEARTLPWSEEVEYVGLHPEFDEVPFGAELPRYQIKIATEDCVTVRKGWAKLG